VLDRYRAGFRPSLWCEQPYVILAVETVCADTDDEAEVVRALTDLVAATDADELMLMTPVYDDVVSDR
jgi:alkanesulfonate monooxygenase SsuD/methylene tetrahydromethanopterin reductase-like flavin-dependent oxidoreductase (luciferase family)